MSILKFFKNLFSKKEQAEMPVTIDLNLKNKDVYPPLENVKSSGLTQEAPVSLESKPSVETQITDAVTVEKPVDGVVTETGTEVVNEAPKKTAKEIKAKAKKEAPAEEKPKTKSKPKPKNK